MKKHLRLLAWLLSLTMLCELLPFAAFAQSDVGEVSDTAESLVDKIIPGDAISFNGNYYKFYDSAQLPNVITWEDASDYCATLGGHLAIIRSQEENDFLYDSMKQAGFENAYFGYSDAQEEGHWVWVDGSTGGYENWRPNEEPNNADGENYAMFYKFFEDKTWNDGDFKDKTNGDGTTNGGHVFICEWSDYTPPCPNPKKKFEFKKDNLSFLNSAKYFFKGEELEYWRYVYKHPTAKKKNFPKKFKNVSDQYGRAHISQDKFNQLTRNLSPNVLSWFHLNFYENKRIWGGSCYGMTTTAAIHFMDPDRIPLSSLSSTGLSDSDLPYELPAPADNTEVENLINYYYISQLLPTRYKIFSTYLYNCEHDFEGTLNEVIQSLSKGIPVIANTRSHSVLLVNVKGTYSDHYVLGVYDPNEEEE